MAKFLVCTDEIPRVGELCRALGVAGTFAISIPQGNKYQPHQSSKEKLRRLKRMKGKEPLP